MGDKLSRSGANAEAPQHKLVAQVEVHRKAEQCHDPLVRGQVPAFGVHPSVQRIPQSKRRSENRPPKSFS
jgi:hypothetical protein